MTEKPPQAGDDSGAQELREKAENMMVPVEAIIPDIQPAVEQRRRKTDAEVGSSSNPQPYAEGLYENFKLSQAVRIFFEGLKDQIVVDLGAGRDYYGYAIALESGAKAYVGVDEFNANGLAKELPRIVRRWNDEKLAKVIPAAAVQEDMLTFLRRLPDGSVSVFCSGIDWTIIGNSEYRKAVSEELGRIIDPQGCYVRYAADIYAPEEEYEREDFGAADGKTYGRERQFSKFTPKKEKKEEE